MAKEYVELRDGGYYVIGSRISLEAEIGGLGCGPVYEAIGAAIGAAVDAWVGSAKGGRDVIRLGIVPARNSLAEPLELLVPKGTLTMNYNEMAGVIERFVDGSAAPWEWEEYFLVMKYDDPFLRYVQQQVLMISFAFPSNSPGEYTNCEGSLH